MGNIELKISPSSVFFLIRIKNAVLVFVKMCDVYQYCKILMEKFGFFPIKLNEGISAFSMHIMVDSIWWYTVKEANMTFILSCHAMINLTI